MNERGYTVRLARKKLMRAFIDTDVSFYEKDNIFYAGKAFTINSIVGWCLNLRAENKITLTEMQYYVSLIQRYIKDELVLSLDDQKLRVNNKE